MDSETLFDILFGACLAAVAVLNVVRWAVARSREASWNEEPGAAARTRPVEGRLGALQWVFVAALAALVLLRYSGVWPKG